MILPTVLIVLWALAFWSALGCDSLREFSFSRLEELCVAEGVPERFGRILKQRGPALLTLEFVLTLVTLALAAVICLWIGWPGLIDGQALSTGGIWTFVLNYAGLALLTFIAADLLPWTVARVASEWFLCRWWPIIEMIQSVLRPGLWIAEGLDRYAHRVAGREESESDDASVIEENIRSVVEEGEREGVLESGSTAMISRVMTLQNEDVGAIMTPRTEMECVSADCTLEEARRELIEAGHSRMPAIGDSSDDVLGILYAKDLLKALEPHRSGQPIPVLRDILREPIFIPATTQIPVLLELMKRQKVHIAIVNDEYGGVAGLVTMEDILEEIVGEIADEYDEDQQATESREVSPTVIECEGRVRIDELNRDYDLGLKLDDNFDTIGGYAFSRIGRMPATGESFEWDGLRVTILDADVRRIQRVRIERLVDEASTTSE